MDVWIWRDIAGYSGISPDEIGRSSGIYLSPAQLAIAIAR